ncbi:hypothetical protein AVEN_74359-1 [Araneus ventricosus]|uniref:Uncharacterized protein n=2 Tax=Araneus ventricosus TaxID=182803 RepID=A0A4Y2M613_ARAVE|nr:hypothetical protein AVEN_242953-1 [Araneus ventricosus]GBN21937.1 hypothetical protein AVEN_74359-1 [Araneus ventricosus]
MLITYQRRHLVVNLRKYCFEDSTIFIIMDYNLKIYPSFGGGGLETRFPDTFAVYVGLAHVKPDAVGQKLGERAPGLMPFPSPDRGSKLRDSPQIAPRVASKPTLI